MNPEWLRREMAALLAAGGPGLAERAAVLAEQYAEALLGGRHPSCARWLPRAGVTCGLPAGHAKRCISVASARNQRLKTKRWTARKYAERQAQAA